MDENPNKWRADALRLFLLVLVAATVRFWLMANTEVLARDSVDFIRIAVRMDQESWGHVWRTSHQAPGYPILILMMMRAVTSLGGEWTSDQLARSAQLVSVLAAILTVVPMYLTGRRLFNRNVGFLAALIWQALPVCVRVTSDGLSEGAFFLFVAWALYFGIGAIQQPSVAGMFACGGAVGLAYLVRPEGGEILLVVGLIATLAGLRRRDWLTPLRLAALAAGVLPFVGTFYFTTGYLTRKPASVQMFQAEPKPVIAVPSPVLFADFWDPSSAESQSKIAWAGRSVLFEANRAAHYGTLVLALLGFWMLRQRWRTEAALWPPVLLGMLHLLVLWRMAYVTGYVSERHTMMTAFAATFFAAAALEHWSQRMPRRWLPTIAIFIIVSGLPSILKPLHANRAGHHAAGRWLAQHAGPEDEIIDPFAWARFYAGAFVEEAKPPMLEPAPATRYVVLEQSGNEHSRLQNIAPARELASRGEPVYQWPESAEQGRAVVVVYRVAAGK